MTKRVRVAVIGVGSMGRNHARVYRELPNVDLVAVADRDPHTVRAIAGQYGIKGYTDYREMLEREQVEAVTVALPTESHCVAATHSLEAGCHVLIEKPIASNEDEALRLVSSFEQAHRVLAVGHIERYNPAVIELKRRLAQGEGGRVFQVHARRLGPFPARINDVGVVVDLAVHDLDIMRYLLGCQPVRAYAETRKAICTSDEDMLVGIISFENGVLGLLETNWLTPTKVRELFVTAERGTFVVNYLTQDLTFYENSAANGAEWSSLAVLLGVNEGAMIRYALKKKEPLRAEQEAFLAAVSGHSSEIVSGRDGLAALQLAERLLKSSNQLCVVQAREP